MAMMLRSRKGSRGEPPVETELDKLQSKYRTMELSRTKHHEDSQNTIRMQRQQIDKLKKDNERLKEDLALETRQAKQASNMTASAQIAKLQDQGDTFARKIQLEQKKIEKLDDEINKLREQIFEQRKQMGGINASRENNQQVQRHIRMLENRLDKALVKLNEALAHNKQLRETIDNLRRDRSVFDGIYRKLEKELQDKKNSMAHIIEISNQAYEARDKAQADMQALKKQADDEQKAFEAHWNELGQLIERDRKTKDMSRSMSLGMTASSSALVPVPQSPDSGLGSTSSSLPADPAIEEELKLRKRVMKGAMSIAQDKMTIHASMEKVQAYEEAFAKIQKATKITDIDELVQTFINAEDENFSRFNHVNELSNEIEKLDEQIHELRSEITKYKGQGVSTDQARKKILEELETRLAKTNEKAAGYEQKYQEAMRTIQALKTGIENIFKKIGCDTAGTSELLGGAGVTESNMMQYLGVIEQRSNELLQLYLDQQQRGGDLSGADPTSSPSHSALVSFQAPSLGPDDPEEDEEEDDEDIRPLGMPDLGEAGDS